MTSLLKLLLSPVLVSAARLPFIEEAMIPFEVSKVKVPVQLGVMSQCPDALLCESVFKTVLESVDEKVDLSLVYVARIDTSDPEFGVRCLHGPQECAGNVQQLCAKKYAPWPNWWEFVQCQNFQGRYKIGLPEIALKCAEAAGIDWETGGAGKCAGLNGSGPGEEGIDLLKQSLQSGQDLGVTKSCTILINSHKVCVHDGTWKECEGGHETADFVKLIEDEYRRLNEVQNSESGDWNGA